MGDVYGVLYELLKDAAVQPEALPQGGNRFRCGQIPKQRQRRVPRQQTNQCKRHRQGANKLRDEN